MNCPDCNNDNTSIKDTRKIEDGDTIRRRRECNRCQFRFTTYERKDWDSLRVKKSDGSTEPYNQEKVRNGIKTAVEKRPVTDETVTELANDITTELKQRDEQIIGSNTIGSLVAERLRDLDEVAYVRFVSVYKGYSNPEEFRDVLDNILADTTTEPTTQHTEPTDTQQ